MTFSGPAPVPLIFAIVFTLASVSVSMSKAAEPMAVDSVSATNSREHVVIIREFAFIPDVLQVSPGDTVIFVNEDVVPHTATAENGSWNSGLMKVQDSWTLIVDSGTMDSYYCAYHPSMKASLQVIAP